MTKNELLEKMDALLEAKGMRKIETLSGKIGANDNKATIEGAIKCLEASDEEMADYLTIVKLAVPNTYRVIVNNGNWLTHSHNRYYVYCLARATLKHGF